MKNQWLVIPIIVLLALSIHAQDSKSAIHTFDGQIMKIDVKGKTLTIKGPKEGLDTPALQQVGVEAAPPLLELAEEVVEAAVEAVQEGADMRRFEDVETKIAWTAETEWISESEDTKLEVSGLRVGDYIKVLATMKGSNVLATTIRRVTSVNGG